MFRILYMCVMVREPGANCHPENQGYAKLNKYIPNEFKYCRFISAARLYANRSSRSQFQTRNLGAGL